MNRHRRNPKIGHKKFIESFMKHNYADEVAAELGLTQSYVGSHAAYLRKQGVKLPKRYLPKLDIGDLNAFIEEIEAEMPPPREKLDE